MTSFSKSRVARMPAATPPPAPPAELLLMLLELRVVSAESSSR